VGPMTRLAVVRVDRRLRADEGCETTVSGANGVLTAEKEVR